MARVKEASGTIEAFLRTNPGSLYSEVSPQDAFRIAHDMYLQTVSGEPVSLGDFIDSLWGRGLTVEQVGARWWLKLPGKNRDHLQAVDRP